MIKFCTLALRPRAVLMFLQNFLAMINRIRGHSLLPANQQ